MPETLDQIRSIVGSLSVPLVADLDTGYDNALNVRRTAEQPMNAGVAGRILEYQQWPKRCGHMEAKRVVDAESTPDGSAPRPTCTTSARRIS